MRSPLLGAQTMPWQQNTHNAQTRLLLLFRLPYRHSPLQQRRRTRTFRNGRQCLSPGSGARLYRKAVVASLCPPQYRSLTTQINSSQERIRELERDYCKPRRAQTHYEEAADVVYERNNLAQALRQAEAKIAAQNAKVDGEEVEDVESLLVKLKRAEKKIANLAFENEMTMQEMAQQAESFEEEIEQEAVARDMDVRAAEKKAEEAIKESEQLKAQLQQVQLKFTGALKQALATNAELSSQLETAKEAASSPVEED